MREVGYRKLIVYQRMMELVELVYELTKRLPADEKFGLISQMRRAVVSVVSNFAEGYLKRSVREKQVYLERSTTSLQELETQAEVCLRLSYWDKKEYALFDKKAHEVAYLLHRYRLRVIEV